MFSFINHLKEQISVLKIDYLLLISFHKYKITELSTVHATFIIFGKSNIHNYYVEFDLTV